MRSHRLEEELGCEVYFKCENFQRSGAFKFRGAYNALANFTDEQKKAGAVAYSTGNLAQGLAYAGKLLGVQANIIMPFDAPAPKKLAAIGYGGNVI